MSLNADELMTRNVVTCAAHQSLEEAAALMWEYDVGCVVVADAERRPVGMLTGRDVAIAAFTQGLRLRDVQVMGTMTRAVRSCSASTPANEVERLVQSAQVRRLPVVDSDGRLVGIVTLGDLARTACSSLFGLSAIPGATKTLAAITERRQPTATGRGVSEGPSS